ARSHGQAQLVFEPGLDEVGVPEPGAAVAMAALEKEAHDGLRHPELPLDHRRGEPDLPSREPLAPRHPAVQERELDPVRLLDREPPPPLPGEVAPVKRVLPDRLDGRLDVHASHPLRRTRASPMSMRASGAYQASTNAQRSDRSAPRARSTA